MAVGSFCVGQRFTESDRRYRLVRDLGDGQWQIDELSTGRLSERSQNDLLAAWGRGTLLFADVAPLATSAAAVRAAASVDEDVYRQSYSDTQWAAAQVRLVYVRQLENVPMSRPLVKPLIAEIWADSKLWKGEQPLAQPPSFSAVAEWVRKYREANRDIRALIAKDTQGPQGNNLAKEVEEFIEDAIELKFMTPERGTMEAVRDHVRGRIAKANVGRLEAQKLRVPSHATIKRRISQISPFDRCRARYGERIANIRFRAAGQGVLTVKPLARACMDHTRLDLMVLDDRTGLLLGRPWLTMVLDEHSRYVLGYYLGFEDPSAVSVMRALRHAIMPKADFLAQFPQLVHGWDAWGAAEWVVVDQAFEFHGDVIRNGAGRFGAVVEFCPRRKPWYKGKIERFFGSLNTGLLSPLPGKTFSNIFEKGEYDAAKHAVIRLSTLREIIATWIVDVYHQVRHGALGCSPAQAWAESIGEVDRWLPASSLSVDSAFSKSETRRLTHKGIEYDSLFYNSQDMRRLRELHGENIEVEIRVMDDDLGSIIVVAPGGTELVRVPAVDLQYAQGMTRWQHDRCKRYQRRLYDDESIQVSLFDARERIRELIRIDMGLIKRGSRKRQARFCEKVGPAGTEVDPAASQAKPSRQDASVDKPAAAKALPKPAGPVTPVAPANVRPAAAPLARVSTLDDDDLPELAGRRIQPLQEKAA